MQITSRYSRNIQAIVLAGVMGLVALSAVAQQEVAPDHFDGNDAALVQKARATKPQKQATPKQATNAGAKPRVREAKANKNSSGPRVVTVAAH